MRSLVLKFLEIKNARLAHDALHKELSFRVIPAETAFVQVK